MMALTVQPGVAGIVFDARHRVLLHRRHVGNGWAPPSGRVEPRESVEDALRRELVEETGLEVAIDRIVGVYSEPTTQIVRYPDDREVHYVTTVVACHVLRGNLSASLEGADWGWWPLDALPEPMLDYARLWIRAAQLAGEPLLR